MDLNKVQLIGRLTVDPELRTTPNGQSVTSFSIATNRSYTDGAGIKQDQAEFHNIVLWWKLAEIASQYLKKWKRVYIEWRLQTRSWEAQDGVKKYKTEIVGENMIMLDGNNESAGSTFAKKEDDPPVKTTPAVKKSKPKDEEEISIADIPF